MNTCHHLLCSKNLSFEYEKYNLDFLLSTLTNRCFRCLWKSLEIRHLDLSIDHLDELFFCNFITNDSHAVSWFREFRFGKLHSGQIKESSRVELRQLNTWFSSKPIEWVWHYKWIAIRAHAIDFRRNVFVVSLKFLLHRFVAIKVDQIKSPKRA